MRIFSRAIATGKEWKPCIECGKVFEEGEAIASFSRDNGAMCTYWYCCDCIEKYIYGRQQRCGEDEITYIPHRMQRLIDLEKRQTLDISRYLPRVEALNMN